MTEEAESGGDGMDQATRAALARLRAAAPEAGEALAGEWVALWDWVAALGLQAGDLPRVAGWVERGEAQAVRVGGSVWLRRPRWGEPPPGYLTVQQFAARRGLSDSRVYMLARQGRVSPCWSRRIALYRHYYVAEWAELDVAPDYRKNKTARIKRRAA